MKCAGLWSACCIGSRPALRRVFGGDAELCPALIFLMAMPFHPGWRVKCLKIVLALARRQNYPISCQQLQLLCPSPIRHLTRGTAVALSIQTVRGTLPWGGGSSSSGRRMIVPASRPADCAGRRSVLHQSFAPVLRPILVRMLVNIVLMSSRHSMCAGAWPLTQRPLYKEVTTYA